MKIYRNGDKCPCCGAEIEGKSEDWLAVFSQLCNAAGLEELPESEIPDLKPIDGFPPPDAGINPPVIPRPSY